MLDVRARFVTAEAPFIGEQHLAEDLSSARDDRSSVGQKKQIRLARVLLRIGETADAIALYDELVQQGNVHALPSDEFQEHVEMPRAVAYLRLGEQQNCVEHNTAGSCLFPISGDASHTLQGGSTYAVSALKSLLWKNPDNVTAKWLLNIAYMTLDRYPTDVPREWLIPAARYEPQQEMPPWLNVANKLGLDINSTSGGSIVEDFDGDGYLDVMASSSLPIDEPGGQLRLFRNNGDGSFTDTTEAAGLMGIRGGLNIVHADYDNNGYPDVFVLRGAWYMEHGQWPNTLLRNNGDGTFSDVTVDAGVLAFHPTQTGAWADYDRDGWIDLFVANETGVPARIENAFGRFIFGALMSIRRVFYPEVQGHLYRNQGDGTFVDVFEKTDIYIFGWVKGVAWGDINGDLWPDLYVSRFAGTNCLYRNDGPDGSDGWVFTDVSESAGVEEPFVSFPTWFFDYNDDGRDDIFVGGYMYPDVTMPTGGRPMEFAFSSRDEVAEFLGATPKSPEAKPRLFRNNGDDSFSDVTEETGLYRAMSPMGANFGDLDNDGFLDMYLGTGTPQFDYLVPNRVFRNQGGQRFHDVSVATNLAHLQKGHGVSFADLDNDGDQDIHIVMGGAFAGDAYPNALFLNPGHGNDWITLKLEGTTANRSAIGARLTLTFDTDKGERRIARTVGSGGSFGGSSLQQEIGLGPNVKTIRQLRIEWPDSVGQTQEFLDLATNRVYRIVQAEPARPVELQRMSFR